MITDCMNSEVVHLTSPNSSGPYIYADTALGENFLHIILKLPWIYI